MQGLVFGEGNLCDHGWAGERRGGVWRDIRRVLEYAIDCEVVRGPLLFVVRPEENNLGISSLNWMGSCRGECACCAMCAGCRILAG